MSYVIAAMKCMVIYCIHVCLDTGYIFENTKIKWFQLSNDYTEFYLCIP